MRHRSPLLRRHCRRHCLLSPAPPSRTSVPMFLPNDLTAAEQDLVDTVMRQLLEHRRPSSARQVEAVRHEAAQVAAEMVLEARAALGSQTADSTDGDQEEEIPDTGHHRRLMQLADRDQEIRQRQAADRAQAEMEEVEDA